MVDVDNRYASNLKKHGVKQNWLQRFWQEAPRAFSPVRPASFADHVVSARRDDFCFHH